MTATDLATEVSRRPIGAMLPEPLLRAAAAEWVSHDVPAFDIGGAVVAPAGTCEARFLAKSSMVVAGYPFAEAVMRECGCTVQWEVAEGTAVEASGANRVVLGVATGPAAGLLRAERTALEVITRSSACATYARRCVAAARLAAPGWRGGVAATRKTSPGYLRLVEKYGALVGGADPHRYSLSTMVMLKDNHIDAAGSIPMAVAGARRLAGFSTKIEVECRSEADAEAAAGAGADIVMLDNMEPTVAGPAARRLKARFPQLIVELSGGVTAETVGSYAVDGVDVVSVGRITHGPPSVDVSMKIVKKTPGVAKL